MSEKIKVPKEVAEALNFFINREASKYSSFTAILAVGPCGKHAGKILHHFQDLDALMSALVNGYEIEQTRDERLREYYEKLKMFTESTSFAPVGNFFAEIEGIKNTLEILGIKIEGMNA